MPAFSPDFDQSLRLVAGQLWNEEKKLAIRSFFPRKMPAVAGGGGEVRGPVAVIVNVLHHLKEEVSWKKGFEDTSFQVGHLEPQTRKLDPVIPLQMSWTAMSQESFQQPLCGVLGLPVQASPSP
jgi:hypothetical protein